MRKVDVLIVGSGFAATILARLLRRRGLEVALVERSRHPRFALGESSTPLAAISLQRLARASGCADLADLGRWRAAGRCGLRVGRKRGFTFYRHRPDCDAPAAAAVLARERLLVAASPSDELADCHWLRSDVDAHLAAVAVAAGCRLDEETSLVALRRTGEGWLVRLRGSRGDGDAMPVAARFLVDAGGGEAGALAAHLPEAAERAPVGIDTRLLAWHFLDPPTTIEVVASHGVRLAAGPYEDQAAAVHHLLDEGWIYELRFDDGRTSVGAVLRDPLPSRLRNLEGAHLWFALLERYPLLQQQLRHGRVDDEIGLRQRRPLASRWRRAAGEGWLRLPGSYAFFDPMFSTGIAWSLVAVERIVHMFRHGVPACTRRYAQHLEAEADLLGDLAYCGLELGRHFETFTALAFVYLAVASHNEVRQRLEPDRRWCWEPFLDVDRSRPIARLLRSTREGLAADRPLSEAALGALRRRLRRAIDPINVVGLGRRGDGLYAADLEVIYEHAALLGMTPQALRDRRRLLLA